jgi:hypothetical protein
VSPDAPWPTSRSPTPGPCAGTCSARRTSATGWPGARCSRPSAEGSTCGSRWTPATR